MTWTIDVGKENAHQPNQLGTKKDTSRLGMQLMYRDVRRKGGREAKGEEGGKRNKTEYQTPTLLSLV